MSLWLYDSESVICPNVRDQFTAGGQGELRWNNKKYSKIPKIIIWLIKLLPQIKFELQRADDYLLKEYWDLDFSNKYDKWIELVIENPKQLRLKFNLKDYIEETIK